MKKFNIFPHLRCVYSCCFFCKYLWVKKCNLVESCLEINCLLLKYGILSLPYLVSHLYQIFLNIFYQNSQILSLSKRFVCRGQIIFTIGHVDEGYV